MTVSRFPITCQEQGTGPAIVFLHGVGGAAEAWRPQLESFGVDHRAIAWDMPGYGGSDPLDKVTFPALAQALLRLFDHLEIERPHIVGHSLGGMIAQELLALYPDRAASLVLLATSPAFGSKDGDFQKKFVADRLAPLDAGKSMADFARPLIDAMTGTDADQEGLDRAQACMSRVSPDTYRTMVKCLVSFDQRAKLGDINVPCLVVAGAEDRTAPAAMMERMAERIPDAEFVCLEKAGHLANMEQPDDFNAVVRRFLDRLEY